MLALFRWRRCVTCALTCFLSISELFEISHIRTIYHMFIAVLLIFFLSTLTVDYIDQGRSVSVFMCVEVRKVRSLD